MFLCKLKNVEFYTSKFRDCILNLMHHHDMALLSVLHASFSQRVRECFPILNTEMSKSERI